MGHPLTPSSAVQELDVIRATRRFLQQHGLPGGRVLDLFTDAHPSLLGATDLRSFRRFTLAFDGFAVHPDLVGRLADGESLITVEAKGSGDVLPGIAQAELYRRGFHLVPLACAAPAGVHRGVGFVHDDEVGSGAVVMASPRGWSSSRSGCSKGSTTHSRSQ